ncbi:predicted protein [Naegleria gruberi]|uniref:Predicted protein n=1 Tax=Naegleria gruberi TaxID=5762 RepID=D2UYM1_NAEGR|nr:uncharacterized protein NAEGRDRAFT_56534 [Naegleria gruberi]EFC50497.1 predicted protein [Naegleria gruberi]|eukprot:XP_002683241.1 predicted protein [Naegleria gruberi strain NEG-M]
MFPRVIDNLTVISGLKNNSSDAIRRVIGSDREMFDRLDPETLQIIKHDLEAQKSSIYSSSSKGNNGQEFDREIMSTNDDINQQQQWKRNSALDNEIKKQESFNQRISEIANSNIVNLEEKASGKKGKGLLDEFLVDPSEENVLTTRRAKSTLNVSTSSAENVFDLYARALPELRAELRQKGLKQVGFIKFNKDSNKAVENLRLTSKENFKHDAFNPLALEDPSLRVLAPKQWKGSLPSPAKDDIIQSAINGLKTHFELNNNFLVQGDPISYDFMVSQENTESKALDTLTIQLVITLTHADTSRTLTQTKKIFKFNEDSPFEIVKPLQTLNLNTKYMDLGSYQLFAQVFLFLPNSTHSSILSSHGPFDIFLTR